MAISATTHLNFRGDARAALEFYRSVFGGRSTVVSYGDLGMPKDCDADRVVFGQVTADNGFAVMAYDVPGQAPDCAAPTATTRENGMTLTGERSSSPYAATRRGGRRAVGQARRRRRSDREYGPSPWAPGFGMLTDRFGVTWILDVATPYTG